MKIAGISYYSDLGREGMYLKPDSALLVNDKPFFIPAFTDLIVAKPCVIVRINRMGRYISSRFAQRYFSEYTIGLNLSAPNELSIGGIDGAIRGTAFDNSFIVGKFVPYNESSAFDIDLASVQLAVNQDALVLSLPSAIEKISQYITLRNGDMIGVDLCYEGTILNKETIVRGKIDKEQVFSCKIK